MAGCWWLTSSYANDNQPLHHDQVAAALDVDVVEQSGHPAGSAALPEKQVSKGTSNGGKVRPSVHQAAWWLASAKAPSSPSLRSSLNLQQDAVVVMHPFRAALAGFYKKKKQDPANRRLLVRA